LEFQLFSDYLAEFHIIGFLVCLLIVTALLSNNDSLFFFSSFLSNFCSRVKLAATVVVKDDTY